MRNRNPLDGVLSLLDEIHACDRADATGATIVMIYLSIDVMGHLSMPAGKAKSTRSDFIAWVDQYLRADSGTTYQYVGKEVYAARCAMIHTYSTKADLHKEDTNLKQFAYHNGDQHRYNANISGGLVIISVKSLVHDFGGAVEAFVNDIRSDSALRERVSPRLPNIVQTFPIRR